MKLAILTCSLVASTALCACGQPPEGRDRRPDGPPPDPFLMLFDADQDGELSTAEMENAGDVLKERDANDDGVLSRDELPRPPHPPGHRGFGRGEGPRGGEGRRGEERFGDDRRGGPRGREGRPPMGPPGEDDFRRPPRRPPGPPPEDEFDPPPRRRPPGPPPEDDVSIDPATAPAGAVVFRGGHDTDPRDGGRPVALIAAALGVESQVFRDAFSGVTPARGRGPTEAEARANKQVLMAALGPHGITNDRLDEVSNYYRYRPQNGELWTHRAAQAKAIVEDGQVVGFEITDAGAGYTTPPEVEVAGYPGVRAVADVEFSTNLRTNGGVTSLHVTK